MMTGSELQEIFSENIKRYRLINNMTQQKLAEMADLSVGYLCSLESGKKWGTPETITKLANALKIEPCLFFMTHDDSQNKDIYNDLIFLSSDLKQFIETKILDLISKNNL